MFKFAYANPFKKKDLIHLIVFGILMIFPLTGYDYLISQLTQFIVYGIFAMSLSMVWGYAGIFCFGHAVFFGLGAYVMALVTKGLIPGIISNLTSSFFGILFAILAVAIFSLMLGYFLFYGRLSGPFLGIVTLAISVIAERIAINWDYIGGFNGLINIPPFLFGSWEVRDLNILFYFILVIAAGIYFFCSRILQSPFGIILAAIRDNEMRAEFFGYNSAHYKIIIFTIGASVAGLAGACFAPVIEFVSPTLLGFSLSTEVLIWVALGGKGNLLAAFLGAIVVRTLESFLSDILTYYWNMVLGLFFIICVMFFPQGIFGDLFSDRRG